MRKKLLLVSTVLTFSVCTLNAQNIHEYAFNQTKFAKETSLNSTIGVPANSRLVYKDAEHWRKLRNAGIITTGVGVASFGIGLAMVASAASDPYYDENDPTPTAAIGALGILGSVPAVIGGAVMWGIGGGHLIKLRREGVTFKAGARSAGLVYRF